MFQSIKSLIKNPLTLWINSLAIKSRYMWRFRRQHLKIGYLVHISASCFGNYNTLNDGAVLDQVILGDFSYIGANDIICRAKIGKFCCFAQDVTVGMGRHPARDFVSIHPIFYSPLRQAQITFSNKSYFEEHLEINIGNDVWIGNRAQIVDGVSIGNGAIVAAGSVVTKDVPPFAIVGGVPAKLIRYRFAPEEIMYLEQLRWWDQDIDWLKSNWRQFHDIKILMQTVPKPDLSRVR